MTDLFILSDLFDKLFCDLLGITVQEADPPDRLDLCQPLQKFRKSLLAIQIHPVQRGLLRHQDQFFYTAGSKLHRFFDQFFHRHAAIPPSHGRNGTVRTVFAAALTYF